MKMSPTIQNQRECLRTFSNLSELLGNYENASECLRTILNVQETTRNLHQLYGTAQSLWEHLRTPQTSQTIWEHLRIYWNLSEKVKTHENASECFRSPQKVKKHVRKYRNLSVELRMHDNFSEHHRTTLDVKECLRTFRESLERTITSQTTPWTSKNAYECSGTFSNCLELMIMPQNGSKHINTSDNISETPKTWHNTRESLRRLQNNIKECLRIFKDPPKLFRAKNYTS